MGSSITLYQISFAVAVIVGMVVTERTADDQSAARRNYLLGVAGGVLGGRLWYAVQYGFLDGLTGFSFFGFAIGATGSIFLWHWWRRGWAATEFPDAVAPGLALAGAIHRLGCFSAGCCFGKVCQLPWAVQYGPGRAAFWRHLSTGAIMESATASLPVHPTQLYEALFGVVAFVVLISLHRSTARWIRFELFLGVGASYSVFRFFIEFLRDDAGGIHLGPLTFAQATSIGILLLIAFLLVYRRIRFSPAQGGESIRRH